MKKLLLLGLLLSLRLSYAQNSTHYNSWFRAELLQKINTNTNLHIILQHRRQDLEENALLTQHFFSQSIWTLLHVRTTDNITISVSPFAYFSNAPIALNSKDITRKARHEFRWTMRLAYLKSYDFWTFQSRAGLEYRLMESADYDSYQGNWRYRHLFRFQKPTNFFGKKAQFIVFDEIFFQFWDGLDTRFRFFDQNRIFLGLNVPVSQKMSVEFGYMNIFQQRGITDTFSWQHNLWLNCIFQNLFTKK